MHVSDFGVFQNQSLHTAQFKLAAYHCEDGDMGKKEILFIGLTWLCVCT